MDEHERADTAACLAAARHYENFPVASRLVPAAWRPHLAAIYAFARGADDLADEESPSLGGRAVPPTPAGRLAALDAWERGLDGDPPPGSEPLFRAVARTRRACGLEVRWFRDLVEAFRWDAAGREYADWTALRAYADRSAAPIGRLVLGVAGARGAFLEAMSDDLSVALQFTNFWQDLSVDWPRRRRYLPQAAWRRAGLDERDLYARFDGRALDPAALEAGEGALGDLVADAVQRTRSLYAASRPLPARAGGELARYLDAVWHGGMRVLTRVESLGAGAFRERPRLSALERLGIAARAVLTPARVP
jgi:phytoene synthase